MHRKPTFLVECGFKRKGSVSDLLIAGGSQGKSVHNYQVKRLLQQGYQFKIINRDIS